MIDIGSINSVGLSLRDAKINHLDTCDVVFFVKHEVFQFNITMHHILAVKVLNSVKNLFHDKSCLAFASEVIVDHEL